MSTADKPLLWDVRTLTHGQRYEETVGTVCQLNKSYLWIEVELREGELLLPYAVGWAFLSWIFFFFVHKYCVKMRRRSCFLFFFFFFFPLREAVAVVCVRTQHTAHTWYYVGLWDKQLAPFTKCPAFMETAAYSKFHSWGFFKAWQAQPHCNSAN